MTTTPDKTLIPKGIIQCHNGADIQSMNQLRSTGSTLSTQNTSESGRNRMSRKIRPVKMIIKIYHDQPDNLLNSRYPNISNSI